MKRLLSLLLLLNSPIYTAASESEEEYHPIETHHLHIRTASTQNIINLLVLKEKESRTIFHKGQSLTVTKIQEASAENPALLALDTNESSTWYRFKKSSEKTAYIKEERTQKDLVSYNHKDRGAIIGLADSLQEWKDLMRRFIAEQNQPKEEHFERHENSKKSQHLA